MRGSKIKRIRKERDRTGGGGQGFGSGRLDYQKPGGVKPLH
jgi:hypothetical protein